MLCKVTKSYFANIILVCTLLVFFVTSTLLYVCQLLIRQQELSSRLSDYDVAITTLSGTLSARVTAFSDFFFPIFNNSDAYDALCELYRSPNGDISAEASETLLSTLHSLCSADHYCCGLLLLTRSGLLYQYDIRYGTLMPIKLTRTIFRFTPYKLQLLTDDQICNLSSALEKPAEHLYGLSGTIFRSGEDTVSNLGYLIVLYSADEFTSALNESGLTDTALFSIRNSAGELLYSSDGSPGGEPVTIVEKNRIPVMISGKKYYISTLIHPKYQYSVTYQFPESSLKTSYLQNILLLVGIGIALSCILLYSVVLRSANHRVNNIRQGMALVGHNNLSYRMPVPRSNDEFTSIIQSFNHMCDELQRNIENTYLFEISQRKAELYAMQTSINPHFLYNALEQIRVQILQGKNEDATQMLLLLSKMYRYQTKRDLFISIGEECAQAENLVNLYSYRFADCDYEFDVENSLRKYGIPKNILQPLIENCFVHGFSPSSTGNLILISICASRQGEDVRLLFTIENNGAALLPEKFTYLSEKLQQPVLTGTETNGFALSNVNSRLKLTFGESASLKLSPGRDGSGFLVSFQIPPLLPEQLTEKLQNAISPASGDE